MLAVRLARLLPSVPLLKVETAKQMPRGLTGSSSLLLVSRSLALVGYPCRQSSNVSDFFTKRKIASYVAAPLVNRWFLKTHSFTSLVHCNQVEILQGKTCFGVVQPSRSITVVSRLGKRKSCKSVLKRFRRVKGGYLKRWRAGKTHLMRKKSSRRRWSDQLTEVVLDLDKPPKDRWEHIVKPKRKEIADFQEYIRHILTPFMYDWISKKVASAGLPKLPKEYAEEIEGIANHLNMPVGDILLGNIFYELEKLCTSIVAQDSYGHIHHARNLDLGALMGWNSKTNAWKITDLLRPLAVTVDFMSQGKTIFKSVQFVGTVGVFTAVKPGKFSFSLNSRDPDHRFGGPMAIIQWLYTSFDDHHFASFWARSVMQSARNYKQAKHLLSTEPLMAPVYFILAGTKRNQGIVISRSKTGSEQPLELSDSRPFLVQTNYDHWSGVPFYDDRRTPATKCLQNAVDAENSLEGDTYLDLSLPGLYNILSTMPVLNKATMYSTLINPKNGTILSYRRYCPGYCYPW